MLVIPKGNVVDDKGFSLPALRLLGILANPQQIVEGNVAKVSNCLVLGSVRATMVTGMAHHVFDKAYRYCKFRLGLRVGLFVG